MVLVATTMWSDTAEARRKKLRGGYNPPFASIVVDAKTGAVLQETQADALRHPASITKVMTLYLLFEQVERGHLHMGSRLRVSAFAAGQAPSKIGFDAGESIAVSDAIRALITKSANDVAVVVAENIGGSVEGFARAMNAKARELGMRRTRFTNPSGLPDPDQVTTARDLSILARAIEQRFPRYFALFSTRSFTYDGRSYRNHNKLLGRIEGVDGIKTGYTRASGFNLMTSAKRDGREIVAIVLGGRSGAQRDQIMANLVESHIDDASMGRRAPVLVAQQPARPRPAVVADAAPAPAAVGKPLRLSSATTNANAGAAVPAGAQAYAPATTPGALGWMAGAKPRPEAPVPPAPVAAAPAGSGQIVGKMFTDRLGGPAQADPAPARAPATAQNRNAAVEASPITTASVPTRPVPRDAGATRAAPQPVPAARAASRSDWVIQVAATENEAQADQILAKAKASASTVLKRAEPFTEKVVKGGSTLWRARFAGFDEADDAQNACKTLKRNGFACFATRG
jgi:D-alanyl-D-alanine carboxypeptidase